MKIEELIFLFFLFSVFGWLFELFLEVAAGRGYVNRGFFYGPIIPVYAAGFFFAYIFCAPLRDSPVLVFLTSAIVCTLLEYSAGSMLETCLNVRAWDYDLHPFTFWCNYKKRIALTASLTFGAATTIVLCFLWDMLQFTLQFIGLEIVRIADAVFIPLFLIDAFFSFRKYLKNKNAGIFTKTNGLGMDYSEENKAFFEKTVYDILRHETFLECKKFIQHGKTTVYDHAIAVAEMCCTLSGFWQVKDRKSLVRAALLHDFFLYDWHTEWNLNHGFTHPVAAAENAKKYFSISEKEYSLIRTHMWPFTLLHPPKYKEAWFICFADKVCSLKEILIPKKHRTQNRY